MLLVKVFNDVKTFSENDAKVPIDITNSKIVVITLIVLFDLLYNGHSDGLGDI